MKIFGKIAIAVAAIALPSMVSGQEITESDIEMWRLDCGELVVNNLDAFSDGYLYEGQTKALTDSCYLIRNGDRYLLWDAGLPSTLVGAPLTISIFSMSMERSIVDQLRDLDLSPADIDMLGISHYHFDHVGQAPDFSSATLLLNDRDIEAVRNGADANSTTALAPWLENGGTIETISGDHDVFDDGSVIILATPGHTPGHSALLVRLPVTGNILLTGDLYHFREQIENRGVPRFNTSRADTLASMEQFQQIDEALDAIIVVQHDPGDIERLPAFPGSAR